MKHNLRSIIILAAVGIIFGCAVSSYAQTNGPIAGGYGTADVNDKDVIAAAKYAVKKEAKKDGAKIRFLSVDKAERQVVAGLNYRLCIKVEVKEKGKKTYVPTLIQTVVYKNLDQKLSLTSWEEAACVGTTL